MKRLIMLLFCLIISIACFCKGRKKIEFKYMELTDSMAAVLDSIYCAKRHASEIEPTRPGMWNLLNPYDRKFHQGIYTYKGMSDHSPRLIFIYYNKKIFSFSDWDVQGSLEDFLQAIDYLKIKKEDQYIYLKAICKFVEEVKDFTYGMYIIRRKHGSKSETNAATNGNTTTGSKALNIDNQIIEESRQQHNNE